MEVSSKVNAIRDPDAIFFDRGAGAIFGQTWEQWSMAWWNWLMGINKSCNPANDADGSNYLNGQAPPVFFLAGTYVPYPHTQSKNVGCKG